MTEPTTPEMWRSRCQIQQGINDNLRAENEKLRAENRVLREGPRAMIAMPKLKKAK